MSDSEIDNMNLGPALNCSHDRPVRRREPEPMPRSEINVAGQLSHGHRPNASPRCCRHSERECSVWAEPRSSGDESFEEPRGKTLVWVAVYCGDVVEDPHDLLGQGCIVALESGSAVEEELLDAGGIDISDEGRRGRWRGVLKEARVWER